MQHYRELILYCHSEKGKFPVLFVSEYYLLDQISYSPKSRNVYSSRFLCAPPPRHLQPPLSRPASGRASSRRRRRRKHLTLSWQHLISSQNKTYSIRTRTCSQARDKFVGKRGEGATAEEIVTSLTRTFAVSHEPMADSHFKADPNLCCPTLKLHGLLPARNRRTKRKRESEGKRGRSLSTH